MALQGTEKPLWLTFDCYGTLIQWDEGLLAVVEQILARQPAARINAATFIRIYDRHEHQLEQAQPHRSFRAVAGLGLQLAMQELGLVYGDDDVALLTSRISAMPPFPEVVDTLGTLKRAGFRHCIISNTDDDIIAGNVAQLGGHVDRVITAEQARAYKPSARIFNYAHTALGVDPGEIVHICASPHLDHAAAREMGFRCIWIDRGTGRQKLPDYTPDATLPKLDGVLHLFADLGWL
ncbi:MAG TPA: haloacid dehalogenase type II [Dongiaceae bacterium]